MTTLFEDRQRAAEYGYVHAEELRFLAVREGVESVARWAAETLGESPEAGADYAAALVGRLVGGADAAELLGVIKRDMEAARRPDLSDEVGPRFSRAVVSASDRLHGTLPPRHEAAIHPVVQATPHPHGFWGWTV